MRSLAPARDQRATGGSSGRWRLGAARLARWRLLALVLLALVGLAPAAHLAQTGGVLASGYTIQRLRAERDAWKVRNQQLELELAKARSLAWIELDAVTRLRMQRPAQQTVVRVDTPPPPTVRPASASAAGPAERDGRPADGRPGGR